MSAIKVEYRAQDWRQLATEAAQAQNRLVQSLGDIARKADLALTLAMPRQVQADLQAIRSAALDAIAANKEIPKC